MAIKTFLNTVENGNAKLLYSLHYEQVERNPDTSIDSLDLAFNDGILNDVENEWKTVMGDGNDETTFMKFEERAGMDADDDDNESDGF